MSTNNPDQAYVECSSRLPVWRYFKKAVNNLTAQCNLCKAVLKTSSGSTKGLHVHMMSIHKIDTKLNATAGRTTSTLEPDNVSLPSTSSGSTRASSSVAPPPIIVEAQFTPEDHENHETPQKKKKISDYFPSDTNVTKEMMISRMVAKDGLPFRVFCTSEDMKSLLVAKGYKLPSSPNTIKKIVMNYGMTLKMKVTEDLLKLRNEDYRFTVTLDEWTSGMNRRFLNVNVHTVINSQPTYWNIGLARVFGSMSSESCVQLLKEKLSEFNLSLDNDIVGITTDGASVMKKVGRLIEPLQQLCYAHGVQLGITDVIYKKNVESNAEEPEEEFEDTELNTNRSGEEEEVLDDNPDNYDGLYFSLPLRQVDLATEYQMIISKLRKCVKLFRNSPTKNDMLQNYIQQEFGKTIQLVLDCKTRWSSLCNMISTYNKVKQCVAKTLVDLLLSSNSDYFFTDEEHAVLIDLENTFQPVKLAVEVLCRRDTDLVSAEHTLRFMVRKLEYLKTPLSEKLVSSMNNRISERRTKATAVLIYLKNPNNYQEDLEQRRGNGIFQLPSKYLIRKEIKNIITRLYRKEPNQADINTAVLIEDDLPLSMIAEDLNLRAAQTNKSLQEELEETLRASKSPFARISTSTSLDKLESTIKKEMDLFECGGTRGRFLQFAYNCFATLLPTSVESERAFSAAGYIATDIRCRLADETINTLCFLRSHFQNHSFS